MGGSVQNGAPEQLVHLLVLLVQKQAVSLEELIRIHQVPVPEPVLAQPLHQRFYFVLRFEVLGAHHLVLEDAVVLPGLHFFGHMQPVQLQCQRRLDPNQCPHHNRVIALVGLLVPGRVNEGLAVLG